nr:immunoglobulin light chain junction region [Macaca mulatta]
CMQVLQTLFTF